MIFPKTKKEITEAILNAIPRGQYHTMPIDNVMFEWWLTGRGGQGLRLNLSGLDAFEMANLEYYDFPLGLNPKSMHKRRIIAPESFVQEIIKKIKCPYYFGVNKNELKEKIVITSVNFKLTKKNHHLNTNYGAIEKELAIRKNEKR